MKIEELKAKLIKDFHYFLLSQIKATNSEYIKFIEKEINKILDKGFNEVLICKL